MGGELHKSDFHHKHCDSDYKDFTFVKFTSQMFSSPDESLKDKIAFATALRWFASDTAHFCVHP